MLRKHNLLMDAAGGDGGNSGGGGGSNSGTGDSGNGTGNSGTGGGGGLLTGQGTGTGGANSATGNQTPPNNGGAGNASVVFPENWKLGLPQELQESGALAVIHDIPSLAKSYINAQKLVGADKIALPSKHATPDEWREVYHKLGLPKELKDYKLEAAKDSVLSKDFAPALAQKAHELGIMPQQAQQMMAWFEDLNKNAMAEMTKSQETSLAENIAGLKKEWGAAFDDKLNDARNALKHFGDQEVLQHLERTGLANDTQLVRLFSKVAEVLKEDGIIQDSGSGTGRMTPTAAREEYGRILSNMDHPYYIKDHPNHKAAVAEVTKLMRMSNLK